MIETTPVSTRTQFRSFAIKWQPARPPCLLARLRALESDYPRRPCVLIAAGESATSLLTSDAPISVTSRENARLSESRPIQRRLLGLMGAVIAAVVLAALISVGWGVGRDAPAAQLALTSAAAAGVYLSSQSTADSGGAPSSTLLPVTSDVRGQSLLAATVLQETQDR